MSEFLKHFQTDSPVLPFLLESILRRVMKMLLLSLYLEKAATSFQLLKLNYKSDSHYLALQSTKLSTVTELLLK